MCKVEPDEAVHCYTGWTWNDEPDTSENKGRVGGTQNTHIKKLGKQKANEVSFLKKKKSLLGADKMAQEREEYIPEELSLVPGAHMGKERNNPQKLSNLFGGQPG